MRRISPDGAVTTVLESGVGWGPTGVTVVAMGLMVAGGILIGAGEVVAGVLIATAGGLLDIVDGALARATDNVTARGGLLDTSSDRIAEAAVWAGVAVHVSGDQQAVALCVTGLAAAMLVPFMRARAEAAGLSGKGGLMGRAERLILLLAGIGFSGLDVDYGFDLPLATLWAFNVLTWATVLHRFYRTWSQLGE